MKKYIVTVMQPKYFNFEVEAESEEDAKNHWQGGESDVAYYDDSELENCEIVNVEEKEDDSI